MSGDREATGFIKSNNSEPGLLKTEEKRLFISTSCLYINILSNIIYFRLRFGLAKSIIVSRVKNSCRVGKYLKL